MAPGPARPSRVVPGRRVSYEGRMSGYDAVLLVSFGGPEKPEDVMPFLQNVTRGRGVPVERLQSVAEHYHHFGGKSPINDQNRALIEVLSAELERHGTPLPFYFGNRNWSPFLTDAIEKMRDDGVQRALALITSPYSSYSGCRQYREDIERATSQVQGAPSIEPLRRFFNHPGFLAACEAEVRQALDELRAQVPEAPAGSLRLAFTAHSIPESMARGCDYEAQLRSNGELISKRLGNLPWELVWQSRSGPPQVPWLEPDILDHLRDVKKSGAAGVVIAPIGFVSDHLEVLYDLDIEARDLATELTLPMVRAKTAGTHPQLVEGLRQLIEERTCGGPVLSEGPLAPRPRVCAVGCCPRPVRPTRPPRAGGGPA